MGAKRLNGEGSIGRRKDGRWEVRVSYIDPMAGQRRRISRYARTQAAARDELKDIRDRLDADRPAVDSKATVAEWMALWRETTLAVMDLRPGTRHGYATAARLHIEPAPFGAIRLDKLKPTDIERLIRHLRDNKKLGGSTQRQIHQVLKSALNTAVRDGALARNPAAVVTRPGLEHKEARYLSAAETSALLAAARSSRYWPALVLIAATGLRRGEALALHWRDINLDAGTLLVSGTISRVNGELVTTPPKTKRSRRTVPLSPAVVAALKAHRAEQKRERMRAANQWHAGDCVFTTELGTPVEPRNLLRVVEQAAKKAGLDNVGVHSLRHSAATALLEGGTHIRAVADLLGHSSPAVTGAVYAHTADPVARAAVDGLADRLGL
jgi:integrase